MYVFFWGHVKEKQGWTLVKVVRADFSQCNAAAVGRRVQRELGSSSIRTEGAGRFQEWVRELGGLSRAPQYQESGTLQSAGREVGPWEPHLGLPTGNYQRQALTLPLQLGDRGPIFRCPLEQTVNSLSSLGLSQARTLRGNGVILGLLETVLVFGPVFTGRGWSLEEGSERPGWSCVKFCYLMRYAMELMVVFKVGITRWNGY